MLLAIDRALKTIAAKVQLRTSTFFKLSLIFYESIPTKK